MLVLSKELSNYIIENIKIKLIYQNGQMKVTKCYMTKVSNKLFDELFYWVENCNGKVESYKLDIVYSTGFCIKGIFPMIVDRVNKKVEFSIDSYQN